MEIVIQDHDRRGAAVARHNDAQAGMMVYAQAGTNLMIIEHTEVDGAYKGQGVGMKLLEALVDKARRSGLKIIPLCPYAKSMFERHEALRDVLK